MSSDAFDKKIREKIQDLPLPDAGHLWDALEQQLPPQQEEQRKRPFGWRWPLAVLLLAAGAATTYWIGPGKTQDITPTHQSPEVENNILHKPQHGNHEEIVELAAGLPKQPVAVASQNTESRMAQEAMQKTIDRPLNTTLLKRRAKELDKKQTIPSKWEDFDAAAHTFTQSVSNARQEMAYNPALQQMLSYSAFNENTADVIQNSKGPWPRKIPNAATLPCNPLQPRTFLQKTYPRYFLEAGVGLFGFAYQRNPLDYLPVSSDTLSNKLSPQMSGSATIMVGARISPNLSLKSGVQLTRWRDQLQHTNKGAEQTITTITIKTLVLPTGDTVLVRDTSTQSVTGTRMVQHHNAHTAVDIPLILGFETGNRVRISINAGIIATIRTQSRGMMPDSMGRPQSLDAFVPARASTTVQTAVYTGVGLMKPIGRQGLLIVEPHARIPLGLGSDKQTQGNWVPRISGGVQLSYRYFLK